MLFEVDEIGRQLHHWKTTDAMRKPLGGDDMDIVELRAQAARYRRLRPLIDDDRMIEVLGDFATEFLARADEIEAELAAADADPERPQTDDGESAP
jgi:hypothetical protein